MRKFDSIRLDEVLRMFVEAKDGKIPASLLLDEEKAPEDWCAAIGFLTEEGFIKKSGDYYEITYRGKSFLHEGGFLRKDFRERILFHSAVIAAVCSLLALLVSLIALICQING